MKQNGVRLVQRKFAQGVPIPASSSTVAPPPPEKKAEPYPPKNVYQNNMSARSLLDIVAMQNIHKHKQEPLVVLERLRDDEIPSPPVPKVLVRMRKRRGLKTNKNNMCLRSGKRKSPDTVKGSAKKRKKVSSESTDDLPLMYYFNRPNQAKPQPSHKPKDTDKKDQSLDREKRTPTPKRKERVGTHQKPIVTRTESPNKSEERSFTFKEPSSPARLSYRLFKKKAAAKAGRALKKASLPLSARWSGLRSARAPSEPRIARPLRSAVLLAKKPPKLAVRKGSRTASKDEQPPSQPGTSGLKAPKSPHSDISSPSVRESTESFSTILAKIGATLSYSSAAGYDAASGGPPSPTLSFDFDVESNSGQPDWCIQNYSEVKSEFVSDENPWTPQRNSLSSLESGPAEQKVDIVEHELKLEDNEDPPILTENTLEEITVPEAIHIENPTKEKHSQKRDKERESADKRQEEPGASNENPTKEKHPQKRDKERESADKRQEEPGASNENPTKEKHPQKRDKERESADKRQEEPGASNENPTKEKHPQKRDKERESADKRQEEPGASNENPTKEKHSQKRDKERESADKRQDEPGTSNIEKRIDDLNDNANIQCMDVDGAVMHEETQKRDDEKLKNKSVKAKTTAKKAVEKNAATEKKDSKKPAAKSTVKETKKTNSRRGSKVVPEETSASTRLLRNSREPPNPDVYEFDAELETSRPPSSLRRRGQATPDPGPSEPGPSAPAPNSPEDVEYVDIFPTSSHCIQITPKKQQESGAECPSVSLVPKEEISIKKKKNLIENLSNSPALLNKFFNCLTAELQTELDNLIIAEGLNCQASTSTAREEASTYLDQKAGSVYEALTFYPSAEEFADPIKYYDKIAPQASRYGLCKIVPPEGFKPPCNMSDTIRFAVIYQYISKMYSRWGPVSRELAAIKAHLRTQSVVFARSPLLDGSEVNLPKLYHAVERNGGLSNVIQRKRWGRVADEMKLTKLQYPERKLDPIYMRYLLPYATLSDQERQNIMAEVEKCWTTKYQKMLERASNPFQRQNRMLGSECESESDDEAEDGNTAGALHEAEDCIVQGRTMNLATFKKIATSLMDAHFEPNKQPPSAIDVEKAYWRAVLLGTEHIVANTASIDTGEEGYGFPKDPEAEYGTHPWNLKVLARNPNNVLRYLGPVLGVTVPTLHLSMLFSTSCWHRDPHGLPWTEYMHSGAEKIWYGIPRDESSNFRRAVETLCPAYCQNKSIWLASEITMVPPNILSEHGVKLSRLLQRPGEYVLVFPEAHSCSITTGFGISESVYFASNAWLKGVYKLFQELRNSCEPTMFSLEQLLLNGSADDAAPQQVCSVLCTLLSAELEHRRALEHKGLEVQERPASSAPLNTSYFRAWNTRDQDECEYCRSTLFLSKVTGLTGRKSAVCPEHALRLLEAKKYKNVELSTLEFLSSYTTSALEEMLERLESRTASEEVSRAPSVIDLTGPDTVRNSESEQRAE